MVVHDKDVLYNPLQVTRDKIAVLCPALPYANLREAVTLPQRCKSRRASGQGVEGEAVVVYREPLTTPDLMSSGFPVG